MKLSIIVTMYNIENYIQKCLDSIRNQTYKDFECIVINDGSTDGGLKLARTFENDIRFCVVDKQNGGVSEARNEGIKRARGEFIVFVDGDDFLDERMLKNIVNILENNKVDAIFSGYKGVYENYEKATVKVPEYKKTLYTGGEIGELIANFVGYSYEDLYNKLNEKEEKTKREFASVWRFVYCTKIIRENKLYFDESLKFGEDIIFNSLYLSLCQKIYISKLSDYNYMYRDTGMVQAFLHEDGCQLLKDKLKLMKARKKATDYIRRQVGIDITDMWQGSIIFSSMHVGLDLSKMKNMSFYNKYSLFRQYASDDICKKAYSKLKLRKMGIKYKLCFAAMKVRLYLLEYIMLSIAEKLGISPGVEG